MAEESTKKRKAEDDTLSEYLDSAVEIARQAGEIIQKGFEKCKHVEHKELAGLVTETHKACADLIFDYLKLLYPNHKFIGKETAASCDTTELTDEDTLTWVIDPLGGTSNFMHGYPFVCVSIGLTIGAWPGSWPTVGVVYNPILDELFTGIRGKGAFLNGNPIRVAKQTELMSALVATEVGTKRDKLTVDACTKRVNNSLFEVRSLRMSGSCALNLCGVACGRLDAYYEVGFGGPWDVAAAAIILREAGGIIFDTSSEDFDITFQDIVTSNSSLIVPLLGVLRETK